MRKKFTLVASLAFAAALCAGVAAANVTAQADTENTLNGFAITATSVRLDDTTKEGVDSGLRFKVDVPEGVTKADVQNAYTKLTFTSSVRTEQNTTGEARPYQVDVPASAWRTEGDGWNTVLLDIPSSDYTTEITAQAFVEIAGVVYETAKESTTIAKTAAMAMANGISTNEEVGVYVNDIVTQVSLDKAEIALEGAETATLTATVAPEGYAVKWTSDNEKVATVDNGVVTAMMPGTANITASVGSHTATCAVTVSARKYFDFETAGQVYFKDYLVTPGIPDQNEVGGKGFSLEDGVGAGDNTALRANFGWSSAGAYLRIDNALLTAAFETATSLVFDIYSTLSTMKYTRYQGTSEIYLLGTSSGTVNGVAAGSLYKYTITLAKDVWESNKKTDVEYTTIYTQMSDKAAYYYLDNIVFVEDVQRTSYDFESADQLAITDAFVTSTGSNVAGGSGFSLEDGVGAADNTALRANFSWESSGVQLCIDNAFLTAAFETATSLVFDIYSTSSQMSYTRYQGTSEIYLLGTNGGTVNGVAAGSLYRYTIMLSKDVWESNKKTDVEYTTIYTKLPGKVAYYYLDNIVFVEDVQRTSYDFESADQLAVIDAFVTPTGKNVAGGKLFSLEDGVGAADNTALRANFSWESSGVYLCIDNAFLTAAFETATSLVFDIYSTSSQMSYTRYEGTSEIYLLGTNGGTVDGVAAGSLYKYTITLTKDVWESNKKTNVEYTSIYTKMPASAEYYYLDNIQFNA